MRTVRRIRRKGQGTAVIAAQLDELPVDAQTVDAKVALIQELIPLGLLHVAESLQQEVELLAGPRYAHRDGRPDVLRHGRQWGSVYLGDQKLPIEVPRVRDRRRGVEIPLATYRGLQQPRRADAGVLRRILAGLSCRDYERCAEAVPEAFGLSASSVSRRYVQASGHQLQEFHQRPLAEHELVALFLDGKTFADDTMVIALGVTQAGRKVLLGFVQTGTENAQTCTAFLTELVARGLRVGDGVLVVIDGGKGLRKAVETAFGAAAAVQRCQWHKREGVVAYLPATQQRRWRAKLQAAYRQPTYEKAKAALLRIRHELVPLNLSAVRSLEEGLEETLTLHRLGVAATLGLSFSTTNCLESVNALVEQRTGKIDHWTNSHQKQRWLATALLDIEPRLRRVKGHGHLAALRRALQQRTKGATKRVA